MKILSSNILIALILCSAFFLSHCAFKAPKLAPSPQNDYKLAKKFFEKQKYPISAAYAWAFISNNENTHDLYESSEFIFAKSLEEMKLYYLAMEYYVEVIRHGVSKEFIGESLQSIFNLMESLPYDNHLLEEELIASSEFSQFSQAVDSNIQFYQGRDDFKKQDDSWGNRKFSKLSEGSLPYYKVAFTKLLKQAVEEQTPLDDNTKDNKKKDNTKDEANFVNDPVIIDEMIAMLEKVPNESKLKNLMRKSIARLLYENESYTQSIKHYKSIDSNVLSRHDVFLEKAWAYFWLYDYQRTLGHLHALKAPHFQDIKQPEKFLLYGMTLRNLCRYDNVRAMIEAFRREYSSSIESIKNGRPLQDISKIKQASQKHPHIHNIYRQQFMVEREQKQVQETDMYLWDDFNLRNHLNRMLELKRQELKAERIATQEKALKEVSEDIIHFNEQMNILEYETRMDEFRRGQFSDTQKPIEHPDPKLIVADPLHWNFEKEFWIDELDLYYVNIESKCEGSDA